MFYLFKDYNDNSYFIVKANKKRNAWKKAKEKSLKSSFIYELTEKEILTN